MYDQIIQEYLRVKRLNRFNIRKLVPIKSDANYNYILETNNKLVFLGMDKRGLIENEMEFYDTEEVFRLKGFFKRFDYSINADDELIKFSLVTNQDFKILDEINEKIKVARPPLRNEQGEIIAEYDEHIDQYVVSTFEKLVGTSYRTEDYDKAKREEHQNIWEGRLRKVHFELEPNNQHDKSAIAVYANYIKVGYFKKYSYVKDIIRPFLERNERHRISAHIVYYYDREKKSWDNYMEIYINR